MLDESVRMDTLKITEISASVAVPELSAENFAARPVLLLIEGEELIGAKQNRILNPSIISAIENRFMDISSGKQVDYEVVARNFISSILGTGEYEYKPVGCDINLRYAASDATGVALVYRDSACMLSFFEFFNDGNKGRERTEHRGIWLY